MNPNPALRRLGFADNDRVVIIHADDIGITEATVSAWCDLVEVGGISSASTMVPCAWFPKVAATCRRHPDVDMGVHLTITSEYDDMRWGPVSTREPETGILDEEGYFHRRSASAQALGDPGAVLRELQAQVERALAAGIDVSHVDSHMGAIGHVKVVASYIQTAVQHQLPLMVLRHGVEGWRSMGLDEETAQYAAQLAMQLEEQGLILLDRLVALPLDDPRDRVERAKAALGSLAPGLTHFIIHPARDTPEIRATAVNSWPSRVADYDAFRSSELRAFLAFSGLQVIGYRALRSVVRSD